MNPHNRNALESSYPPAWEAAAQCLMLENLIYHWKVRRLRREKRRLHNFYKGLSKKARVEKKSHEHHEEEMMETELIDSELYLLHTQRLLEVAEDKLLPTPEFKTEGGAWEQSHLTGRWRLTMEAIAELRSDIRKEKRESSEHWRLWLAAWTGVIGALIGLTSVLIAFWKK